MTNFAGKLTRIWPEIVEDTQRDTGPRVAKGRLVVVPLSNRPNVSCMFRGGFSAFCPEICIRGPFHYFERTREDNLNRIECA